jgi:hypothetical protein
MGHAKKERAKVFGTDQRGSHQNRRPKRPHSQAGHMAAPECFAQSRIPLAPWAPSIDDPYDNLSSSHHEIRPRTL